jgi:hypothetical protein
LRPGRIRGVERLESRALLSVGGRSSTLLETGGLRDSIQNPAVETRVAAPVFHEYGIVREPVGKRALGPSSPLRVDSTSLVLFTSSTSSWVILIFPIDSSASSPVQAKRAILADPPAGVPAKVTSARLKAPVSNKAIDTGPSPILATSLLESSMIGGDRNVNPLRKAVTSQLDLATVRSLEVFRTSQHATASRLEMPATSPRSANYSSSIESVVQSDDIRGLAGLPENNALSLFARSHLGGDGEGLKGLAEMASFARIVKSPGTTADNGSALAGIASPGRPGDPLRSFDVRAFDAAIEDWVSRHDDVQANAAVRHANSTVEWLPQDAGLLELPAGDAAYFMPQQDEGVTALPDRWVPAREGESELSADIGLFQAFELASLAGEDTAANSDPSLPSIEAGMEMASPFASPSSPPPAQDRTDRTEDAPEADWRLYFTGAAAVFMVGGRLLYGHALDRSRGADFLEEASQHGGKSGSEVSAGRRTV